MFILRHYLIFSHDVFLLPPLTFKTCLPFEFRSVQICIFMYVWCIKCIVYSVQFCFLQINLKCCFLDKNLFLFFLVRVVIEAHEKPRRFIFSHKIQKCKTAGKRNRSPSVNVFLGNGVEGNQKFSSSSILFFLPLCFVRDWANQSWDKIIHIFKFNEVLSQ